MRPTRGAAPQSGDVLEQLPQSGNVSEQMKVSYNTFWRKMKCTSDFMGPSTAMRRNVMTFPGGQKCFSKLFLWAKNEYGF
jgi:hypothetical protein